jgi:type IV secretion system protein VirD4
VRPFDLECKRAPLAAFNLNFESTHLLKFSGSGVDKSASRVVLTAPIDSGSMVVLDPACAVGG